MCFCIFFWLSWKFQFKIWPVYMCQCPTVSWCWGCSCPCLWLGAAAPSSLFAIFLFHKFYTPICHISPFCSFLLFLSIHLWSDKSFIFVLKFQLIPYAWICYFLGASDSLILLGIIPDENLFFPCRLEAFSIFWWILNVRNFFFYFIFTYQWSSKIFQLRFLLLHYFGDPSHFSGGKF